MALVLYLSDLKLNPSITASTPLSSLSLSDLILDSQEVGIWVFFSPESPSPFFHFFEAIFLSFVLSSFSSQRIPLAGHRTELLRPSRRLQPSAAPSSIGAYHLQVFSLHFLISSHRNLRFVATACVLSFSRGIVELEVETVETVRHSRSQRNAKSLQYLVDQCHDLQEQLYTQVYCHRCRDIAEPTRLLTLVAIGGKREKS